MPTEIKVFFDESTATFTYVVEDIKTKKAAIIDSVLDYDQYSGKVSTKSADAVIQYIKEKCLDLEWILETHIHADHITGSHYIKQKIGGRSGIGKEITKILAFWVPIFNTDKDTKIDGSQFDALFDNDAVIMLGESSIKVLHTPGHTPACVSYWVDDAVFVGDTLFMPDVGTARADFPGGDAKIQYDSIKKLFELPNETRVFMCHDYPPEGRAVQHLSTIGEEKAKNVLLNERSTKEEYVRKRHLRDESKAVPKLLLPSIQANMRGGDFGAAEKSNKRYVKIPVDFIGA